MQPGVPCLAPEPAFGIQRRRKRWKRQMGRPRGSELADGLPEAGPWGGGGGLPGKCPFQLFTSKLLCVPHIGVHTFSCGSGVRNRKRCALFLPLPSRPCQPILVRGWAGGQLTSSEHRFLRRALLFSGAPLTSFPLGRLWAQTFWVSFTL